MKKRPPNRSPNSLKVFTMRISPEHISQMETQAKAEGVALRTLGRKAIEFYLNAQIEKTPA